jgi:hypothetical protein
MVAQVVLVQQTQLLAHLQLMRVVVVVVVALLQVLVGLAVVVLVQ